MKREISYKELYAESKKLYLLLGGMELDTLRLSDWEEIKTSGKQNCGIYISKKYPDRILKCDSHYDSSYMEIAKEINMTVKLFPELISITDIGKKTYLMMERLDGDLQQLFDKSTDDFQLIHDEIIKLRLLLYDQGYEFTDHKFDNYGYTLTKDPKERSIRYGDKYLTIYFIDWSSGLNEITSQTAKNILYDYNTLSNNPYSIKQTKKMSNLSKLRSTFFYV